MRIAWILPVVFSVVLLSLVLLFQDSATTPLRKAFGVGVIALAFFSLRVARYIYVRKEEKRGRKFRVFGLDVGSKYDEDDFRQLLRVLVGVYWLLVLIPAITTGELFIAIPVVLLGFYLAYLMFRKL